MKNDSKAKRIRAEFGKVVRKKRHKLDLSQEKFAELANIHRTYVSSIELGKVDVGISVASKIATALKTTLSKILKEIKE